MVTTTTMMMMMTIRTMTKTTILAMLDDGYDNILHDNDDDAGDAR